MTRSVALAALLALAAACVPLPPGALPPAPRRTTESHFQRPDGAQELASLHFTVIAADPALAKQVSDEAESDYQRIMLDTNLYSFMGDKPYPIYVYANQQEYMQKTGMPQWSGGAETGDTIALFPGEQLDATLAHEMTHVIFFDVFGSRVRDFVWLNEGLAMYEESQSSYVSTAERNALSAGRSQMVASPLPFSQMMNFTPLSEQDKLVSLWYMQAMDVVRFMIQNNSRMGFSVFLKDLANGQDLNYALSDGFSSYGQIKDQNSLEAAWKASL